MTVTGAEENQGKRRRRRIVEGLLLAAAALGVPALVRRARRRAPARLLHDWGRARSFLWRGTRVGFQQAGSGPPIVFVHSLGLGTSAAQWSAAAEVLDRRFTVIAPDLPGWGRSEGTLRPPTSELYGSFLRSFLVEVVRQPAVVVAAGHSAAFAIRAAVEIGRVRALGLVVPRGLGEPRRDAIQERFLSRLVEVPVVGSSALELLTSRREVRRHLEQEVYIAPERVDERVVERHFRLVRQPDARHALAAYLTGDLDDRIDDHLRRLEGPVWLAWGRLAAVPPVEDADRWLQAVPDARLDVFERSALLPHLEEAGSFCRSMGAFLDGLPGAA